MSEALKEEILEETEETSNENEEVTPIVVPSYVENEGINKRKKKRFGKRKKKPTEIPDPSERYQKKKKVRMLRQTPYILPFLRLEADCIYLKNGVMDMFQIETKDLYSLNDEEIYNLIAFEARFLRSYSDSFKEVSLNFPANTDKQIEYWTKKREKTSDPFRLKLIDRKLFELDFIATERSNREFIMFIYAENEQQLAEKKKQMIRSKQSSFPLKPLSKEKKQDILYLMLNQNSKL